MLFHKFDCVVERDKVFVRDDAYSGFHELVLPKCAVVLKPVCVGSSANDKLAFLAQFFRLCAEAAYIVKNNYISPGCILLPVLALGKKTVPDFLLRCLFNEVFYLMAFVQDAPCSVLYRGFERNKKKFFPVHYNKIRKAKNY